MCCSVDTTERQKCLRPEYLCNLCDLCRFSCECCHLQVTAILTPCAKKGGGEVVLLYKPLCLPQTINPVATAAFNNEADSTPFFIYANHPAVESTQDQTE